MTTHICACDECSTSWGVGTVLEAECKYELELAKVYKMVEDLTRQLEKIVKAADTRSPN